MTERDAFLAAIDATAWDDELPRLVYADWLDERGEPEEADRQRKYVPSVRWLRAFALRLTADDYEPMSYETLIEAARTYLRAGNPYILPVLTPDVVYEQREEFWKNVEIVTGVAVPDTARKNVIFSCAC